MAASIVLRPIKSGFTIIELLVVIAVVGVLAGATIAIINPGAMIKRAQDSTVKGNFKNIITEIEGTRVLRNLTLLQITGNGCSDCVCRCADARSDSACIASMNTAWTKVAGKPMPKDPWGNVYVFDENEQEGSPTNCTPDGLRSAGPDHILGDGSCSSNSADDMSSQIPVYACP